MEAAYKGDLGTVQYLVHHDIMPPMAAQNGGLTVIQHRNRLGCNILHCAVLGNNVNIVEFLLQNCPNVCEHINDISSDGYYKGWTAYGITRDNHNEELMQMLVCYGADPNSDTYLHALIKIGRLEEAKEALRSFDIDALDINAINRKGFTALDLAYKTGDDELIRLLLEKDARYSSDLSQTRSNA